MSSHMEDPLLGELPPSQLSPTCPGHGPAGVSENGSPQSQARHLTAQMQRALQPLCLSLAMLRPVMERMLEAMERGLSHRTHDQATVRMLPAFIRSTPDGTERGDFLVLDLGETRLRVLLVELRGEERQTVAVQDQTFPVSEELRRGSGQQLFAFMAKCLWEFLDGRHPPQRDFELGLSFPFTCHQTRLDQSILISWSKGFTCPGVEGQDVVRLLQNAIDEQDVKGVPPDGTASGQGVGLPLEGAVGSLLVTREV